MEFYLSVIRALCHEWLLLMLMILQYDNYIAYVLTNIFKCRNTVDDTVLCSEQLIRFFINQLLEISTVSRLVCY